MDRFDFKKAFKSLYNPPAGAFVIVDVPPMQFIKVDGEGDPNTAEAYRTALNWLYGVSYAIKFAARGALARDFVVPPLEGLWRAEDPQDFIARHKDAWRWTMMIPLPDFVTCAMFDTAVEKAARKLGRSPQSLRLEPYEEGLSLQTLHRGSYDDEGPVLARLHGEVMAGQGLTFNGLHHEIYLNDPRRTAPARLKTILRQPVKRRS